MTHNSGVSKDTDVEDAQDVDHSDDCIDLQLGRSGWPTLDRQQSWSTIKERGSKDRVQGSRKILSRAFSV